MKTISQESDKKHAVFRIARKTGIVCGAIFVAAMAMLAVMASSKSKSEAEVKVRYDGQTYQQQGYSTSPSSGGSWSFGIGSSNMTDLTEGIKSDAVSGAPAMNGSSDAMAGEWAADNEYAWDDGAESPVGQHGKKIAYYYDFRAETTGFDEFVSTLEGHIAACGGYMESSSVDTREFDNIGSPGTHTVRLGRYSFRLPAADAAEFRSFLSDGGASVIGSDVRMEDRTAAYADADLQARSYRAEYEKLEALIPQAGSVDELIQIQDRLSSLNYQIQWAEKQKDLIDEDVEMSSVELDLYEVLYYTATVESYKFRFGERVAGAFEDFIYSVPEFLFAMVYVTLAGFVIIGLCSVMFRVLFNIRNKKSREQTIRLVGLDDCDAGNKKE